MSDALAVVDLGTNTFHLLIVRRQEKDWESIYRERIFVNLAEENIRHIGAGPWQRGLAAMQHFRKIIEGHKANVRAVGTAALRRAENAQAFLKAVSNETGIHVEVISGEQEAALISSGVMEALPPIAHPLLIMDIGGGSVECILHHQGRTIIAESYPLGVAVLYESFHDTEPISHGALARLDAYLEDTMHVLLEEVGKLPETVLVGASGTFEVIDHIVHRTHDASPFSTFDSVQFKPIYDETVSLNLEERLRHPLIPENRARYVVTAFHLIHFILSKLKQNAVYISAYAMKEGIVRAWLDKYLDASK